MARMPGNLRPSEMFQINLLQRLGAQKQRKSPTLFSALADALSTAGGAYMQKSIYGDARDRRESANADVLKMIMPRAQETLPVFSPEQVQGAGMGADFTAPSGPRQGAAPIPGTGYQPGIAELVKAMGNEDASAAFTGYAADRLKSALSPPKSQIFGDSTSGYSSLDPQGKVKLLRPGVGVAAGKAQIFGNETTGYYTLDPQGKVKLLRPGVTNPQSPKGKFAADYAAAIASGDQAMIKFFEDSMRDPNKAFNPDGSPNVAYQAYEATKASTPLIIEAQQLYPNDAAAQQKYVLDNREKTPADNTPTIVREAGFVHPGDPEAQRQYVLRNSQKSRALVNIQNKKAPEGMHFVPDPANPGGEMLVPIKGSPQERAERKRNFAAEANYKNVSFAITDLERMLAKKENITGGVGSFLSLFPGTKAKDAQALITTIRANLGFQQLTEMRLSSPTGAGLGNVTEKEIEFLQATVASLDQAQSPEQFAKSLQRIKQFYKDLRGQNSANMRTVDGKSVPAPIRLTASFEKAWSQRSYDAISGTFGPVKYSGES